MRKFILIAVLALVSANAEAGQTRGLTLASNEQPQTTESVSSARSVEVEKSQPQAQKPVASKPVVKRETDEAKARRIAARYGISW